MANIIYIIIIQQVVLLGNWNLTGATVAITNNDLDDDTKTGVLRTRVAMGSKFISHDVKIQ